MHAVMALLASALTNATAPLVQALEAAEQERLLTEKPAAHECGVLVVGLERWSICPHPGNEQVFEA